METQLPSPVPALLAKPPRSHLFTPANAKEMSARGNAAKARAKLGREELIARANGIASLIPDDEYRIKRLARVRTQLEKLDGMVDDETDPQKLDKLASAQARLAKQEQELSGRPLPGSRRPGREKSKRELPSFGPLDE